MTRDKDSVSYREMVEFFEARFDRIDDKIDVLQNQLNNQKLLTATIGGAAGIISAILNPFKK